MNSIHERFAIIYQFGQISPKKACIMGNTIESHSYLEIMEASGLVLLQTKFPIELVIHFVCPLGLQLLSFNHKNRDLEMHTCSCIHCPFLQQFFAQSSVGPHCFSKVMLKFINKHFGILYEKLIYTVNQTGSIITCYNLLLRESCCLYILIERTCAVKKNSCLDLLPVL